MQNLILKIQVRTWNRGQKSWDLPIRLLCLPQSPWVEVVLLNYIKNEIEKAEVKLLSAGNQMPADNDKLLEKLLLALSSGNMISSWINDIKSRSLPPGLCQESSSYLIVFFCSFSAFGQTGLKRFYRIIPLNTDQRSNTQEAHILITSSLKQCACESFSDRGKFSTLSDTASYYS